MPSFLKLSIVAGPNRAANETYAQELLREMAQMMIEDDPDLVLLQEVPVWAADLLQEHTGMGVTLAPTYGAHIPFLHVPLPLATRFRKQVDTSGDLWMSVIESTGQPVSWEPTVAT